MTLIMSPRRLSDVAFCRPVITMEVLPFAADVARLDQESWQEGRDEMLSTCSSCHSSNFAREQLRRDVGRARDEGTGGSPAGSR